MIHVDDTSLIVFSFRFAVIRTNRSIFHAGGARRRKVTKIKTTLLKCVYVDVASATVI